MIILQNKYTHLLEHYKYVVLYHIQDYRIVTLGAYVRYGDNSYLENLLPEYRSICIDNTICINYFNVKKYDFRLANSHKFLLIRDNSLIPQTEVKIFHTINPDNQNLKGIWHENFVNVNSGQFIENKSKFDNLYIDLTIENRIKFSERKLREKILSLSNFENREPSSKPNFLDSLLAIRKRFDVYNKIFVV